MRRASAVGAMVLVAALSLPAMGVAAAPRACAPVTNPYPGTRYEGVDLSAIRAVGAACPVARRVARGAHAAALRQTPPADGVRVFAWRGWRVRGDLRGPSDRYVATRADARVTWRF